MGDDACRPGYLELLRAFLGERPDELCPEHAERMTANPLRVLDCKRPECRAATADAPRLVDHLCDACRSHFERVQAGLDALGIPYALDHRLVRGFDYYTRTTFEFSSDALGVGPERNRWRRPLRRAGGDARRAARPRASVSA